MDKEKIKKIGQRIKLLRKKTFPDISANDFAAELGINSRTYGSYERGEVQFGLDFIILIAEKFNVDLNYIVYGRSNADETLAKILDKLDVIDQKIR